MIIWVEGREGKGGEELSWVEWSVVVFKFFCGFDWRLWECFLEKWRLVDGCFNLYGVEERSCDFEIFDIFFVWEIFVCFGDIDFCGYEVVMVMVMVLEVVLVGFLWMYWWYIVVNLSWGKGRESWVEWSVVVFKLWLKIVGVFFWVFVGEVKVCWWVLYFVCCGGEK